MIITLCALIVLLLLYKYAWPKKKYWESRGLPAYKVKMLLSYKNVVHEIGDVFKKMKGEGQQFAGLYLTWEKLLFVTNLPHELGVPDEIFETVNEGKLSTKLLNNHEIFQILLNSANNLITVLQEAAKSSKQISFNNVSTLFTTESLIELIFGTEFNKTKLCTKMRDVSLDAGAFSLKSLVRQFIVVWFPKIAEKIKIRAYDPSAHNFFVKTIKEVIEWRRKQANILRNDFLQYLLDAENHDGEKVQMSIEEIAEHIMSYFVNTVETSAVTLSYSLIEIKQNPCIESDLRLEIRSILEKHKYTLTLMALNEMTYLDKVFEETLRKYPPIPIIRRRIIKSCHIPEGDIKIEENWTFATSLLAIQRDEASFEYPNIFNPNRKPFGVYMDKVKDQLKRIDWKLLELQCKIALVLILWNFEYELPDNFKFPLEIDAPNGILTHKDKICFTFSQVRTSL